MKTILISLASVASILSAVSCSPQIDRPGDTSVETRVTETNPEPGNITAGGRIETTGQ